MGMTITQVQYFIRNLDLEATPWERLMDRKWYSAMSPQKFIAEMDALHSIRAAMPWGSSLWRRFRQAYKAAFSMEGYPTYDCTTKLLSRLLSQDPAFSGPSGRTPEGQEQRPPRLYALCGDLLQNPR